MPPRSENQDAAADKEDGTDELDHEFGAVFDTDKVIGDADEVEKLECDECRKQRQEAVVKSFGKLRVAEAQVDFENHCNRDENHGDEGDAAETGHKTLVDFALVNLVEKIATISDEENLWNQHTCTEGAKEKGDERINRPVSHKTFSDKNFKQGF